jgi:uncharacterized protein
MRVANRFARQVAWACALALLAAAGTAMAQRVEGDRAGAQGPYEAEVPVRTQNEGEREAGFARALAQVFGKLSGDRSVASRPGVGQELRRAADYVAGFDYRQDESVGASGAPSYQTMLVVRFKEEEVDAVAAALGLPVWPTPRPRPVLWLAIDDGSGSGPRLVGLSQNNAARPILQRAIERGYRLGLPAGNAAEQAAAGAIWRGDTAAIARLSARYNPPMQLLGKLYRADGGWQADWIFVDGGRVLSRWSESHADARRAMATGADGAADALSRRYAKASPAGQQATQRIVFTGIHSAADYLRLSGALQRMSVVRGIRPVRAMPDGLEVDLDLLTGLAGFRRMADGEVLVEAEGGDGLVPMFRLR